MEIVIATANRGKVEEIRDLLGGLPISLLSLHDLPSIPPLAEGGKTYLENATQKAMAVYRVTGRTTIGEDSGLEVDALDGEPGPLSRRFGGEGLSDSERNALLLERLEGLPIPRRTARFRCVVALVDPRGTVHTFDGACEGSIATSQRGNKGFGYDPVFLVPQYGRTLAELGPEVKNRISHRARAFAEVRVYLAREIGRAPASEPPGRN